MRTVLVWPAPSRGVIVGVVRASWNSGHEGEEGEGRPNEEWRREGHCCPPSASAPGFPAADR